MARATKKVNVRSAAMKECINGVVDPIHARSSFPNLVSGFFHRESEFRVARPCGRPIMAAKLSHVWISALLEDDCYLDTMRAPMTFAMGNCE